MRSGVLIFLLRRSNGAVAAFLLGAVERLICCAKERIERVASSRPTGEADADGHAEPRCA